MEKVVNIIVDASGSMCEDEKNAVVKYLLNGISSAKRNFSIEQEISFNLFQWGKETKQIADIEKAKIIFEGKSDLKGLDEIGKIIDKQDSVLFISDGNLEISEKKKLKELSDNILTIYVGVDANKAVLQDISTNKVVYSVVDFMQALFDA